VALTFWNNFLLRDVSCEFVSSGAVGFVVFELVSWALTWCEVLARGWEGRVRGSGFGKGPMLLRNILLLVRR